MQGVRCHAPCKLPPNRRRSKEEAAALKEGKPSFAQGRDKQGGGATQSNELKELRAQLAELKRKVASPAAAAFQGQHDEEM